MKISKKYILAGLLPFIALIGCFSIFNASAQPVGITDEQASKIRSNCVFNNNTLSQLHSSDALLRVNRGQVYELMATKLMNGFNGRVAINNLNNSNLVLVTKSYKLALDSFRVDYKTYEEHLTSAMVIDCQSHPDQFYNAVMLARDKRAQVHLDIQKLNQYISDYQAAIVQLEKDYHQTNGEVKH